MPNASALGALRRRWWIIVLLAVLGAALAALPDNERVQEQAEVSYTATHTMLVNNQEAVSASSTAVSPSQVTLLATTGEVPSRVKDAIGYDGNPAELASLVLATFDFQTGALTFTVTGSSAKESQDIADAFADETNNYLAERQDVVYQERLAASIDRLEELETELQDLTEQLASDSEDAVLAAQRDAISRQYSVAFEQAEALADAPPILAFTTLQRAQAVQNVGDEGVAAPTSRVTRAIMGFVVGGALGVGVVLLLSRFDRRIRTREQAEAVIDMRARVVIPKSKDPDRDRLVVTTGRHDPLSDSYRTVRNVVGFIQGGLPPVSRARVTMVVSPGPGDGKTSLAANLAAAFVESGQRTIAVNSDFRRPRLAGALTKGPITPFPFILEDLEVLEAKSLLTRTDLQNLLLLDLSTIDGTAGELARATAGVLPALAEIADAVVVDTSPVGATAEVLDMVPLADLIVVVARVGHTSIESAERTIAILRDVTTVPLLLVLTGLKPERAPYYEYTDRRKPDDTGERHRPWKRRLEKVG